MKIKKTSYPCEVFSLVVPPLGESYKFDTITAYLKIRNTRDRFLIFYKYEYSIASKSL